jgi:hypothetical protein
LTPREAAPLLLLAYAALAGCVSLPTREELISPPGPEAALDAGEPLVDGRSRFRDIFCALLPRDSASGDPPDCSGWLWRLDDEAPASPQPMPAPDRTPQVYLVTGAFSECLGDEARPFNGAVPLLTAAGYRISTIVVSGRSGPAHNARQIAERLSAPPAGEEGPVVLIGYSKGANDILEFLVSYPDIAARVSSVVSIAGAVGGSPLAAEAEDLYDLLLRRLPSKRCPPGDGGVVASLRPEARREWLATHRLPGGIRYYSVAAFTSRERVARVLVSTWKRLLRFDHRADGQLLARDALIPGSTLLAYLHADHWSAAIDVEAVHPVLGARRDRAPFPRGALLEAILLQLSEATTPGPAT